jgi:hypothetical protein
MSKTVIKIENLSKLYRLGVWGSSTLRDEFARNWAPFRGKQNLPDNYLDLTIGQTNTTKQRQNDTTTQRKTRHHDTTTSRHHDTTTQRHNDITKNTIQPHHNSNKNKHLK